MFKTLPLAALVLCLFSACSKSDGPAAPSFTPGYNVYITGFDNGKGVYWVNGVEKPLTANAQPTAIAVSGADVYVGGYVSEGDVNRAAYWKNGQEVLLAGPGVSHVSGIAVSGNDVYCVGDILVQTAGRIWDSAVYWKNGVVTYLSPHSIGHCTGILIAGSEVYISGQVTDRLGSDSAVVWKNGVKQWYSSPGQMNAMALASTDTLFTGSTGVSQAYWTHDKYYPLQPAGEALCIAASGQDVYVGGDTADIPTGRTTAAYWKNSKLTILSNTYEYSTVLGIGLAGTDLYAAGYVANNNPSYSILPVYWKNGKMYELAKKGGVSAMTIQPQ